MAAFILTMIVNGNRTGQVIHELTLMTGNKHTNEQSFSACLSHGRKNPSPI